MTSPIRSWIIRSTIASLGLGCSENELDLGHSGPQTPGFAATYATREAIAAEADAGPGVPTTFAELPHGRVSMAVDDTRVYWAQLATGPEQLENGFVRSCRKDDCAGTVIIYATGQSATQIGVNATHVFWSTESGIDSCPISGCPQTPQHAFPWSVYSAYPRVNFVVDDSHVYILTPTTPTATTILRCPIEGCHEGSTLLVSIQRAPDERSSSVLAMDATNLYWIEGEETSSTSGTIRMVPKDGSSPGRALAARAGHLINAVTSNGTNLYWVESHRLAEVKGCSLSSCSEGTTSIASSQQYPYLLAVGGDFAYWFRSERENLSLLNDAHLVECPLAGCGSTPDVLAVKERTPVSIAVDATHIYWATLESESSLPASGQWPPGRGSAVKRIRRSH